MLLSCNPWNYYEQIFKFDCYEFCLKMFDIPRMYSNSCFSVVFCKASAVHCKSVPIYRTYSYIIRSILNTRGTQIKYINFNQKRY